MRTLYIVSYDIVAPRRWRKVYRLMCGHGDRVQYSVFRCALSDRERIQLIEKLSREVKHTEDQVLFFPLGPVNGLDSLNVASVGLPYAPVRQGAVIA